MSNYTAGLKIKDLGELTGIPRTTLLYYREQGYFRCIPESKKNDDNVGKRYSLKSAQTVLTIARLKEKGVSFQEIGKITDRLQDWDLDLAEAVLVVDHGEVFLSHKDKVLQDLNSSQLLPKVFVMQDVAKTAEKFYKEKAEKVA